MFYIGLEYYEFPQETTLRTLRNRHPRLPARTDRRNTPLEDSRWMLGWKCQGGCADGDA
jgi:hypothetical protein